MIQITTKGRDFIKRGNLWIFANEFATKVKNLTKGEWTDFYCKNDYLGYGYVNPNSLIAGRIVSRVKVSDRKKMFIELIKKALFKRDLSQKSYRAVFAESDDLPGLIIDVYDRTIVAQSSTAGMDAAKEDWKEAILEVLNPENFVVRADGGIRGLEGIPNWTEVVKGDEKALHEGVVTEGEVLIAADFVKGQKTGFFIDQRDNRQHLMTLAKGKRILDLCCYSGGWGLSALKADASHVTFVDQSAEAIELVKRGIALNKFDEKKTNLVVKDVFDFLKGTSEKFDIIIADPPAFVKSKKNIPQAEQAYFRLNALSLKLLVPEGMLYSCSCSYHMSDGRFAEIIADVFCTLGVEGVVAFRGGQSADHPWVINRPESKYLKCLMVRKT